MARPELSLVIPIYNEEEVLPQLAERLEELLSALALDVEVIFVNDGSRDQSMAILRGMAAREPRYRVLGFSRNFGHQRAITAGMDKARGRAVVVIDADLQDPPEIILEMVAKWREGYDVVYGKRRSREGESAFKLLSAKLFYRVFAALIPIEVPLDTGDFRLMSRRVVMTMRGLGESHRFVRGLVAWVGFKQIAVEYDRAARAAGDTKYPLKKMIAFALDGIASFSIQPLRFATYIGVFVGTASVLYAIASTLTYYAGMNVPGWTTTVVLVSFLFSVQFFMIGVLGEYVGRIYEQVKRRPLYIVSERINFRPRKVERLLTQDLEEIVAVPPLTAPPRISAPPRRAATQGETPSAPTRISAPPRGATTQGEMPSAPTRISAPPRGATTQGETPSAPTRISAPPRGADAPIDVAKSPSSTTSAVPPPPSMRPSRTSSGSTAVPPPPSMRPSRTPSGSTAVPPPPSMRPSRTSSGSTAALAAHASHAPAESAPRGDSESTRKAHPSTPPSSESAAKAPVKDDSTD